MRKFARVYRLSVLAVVGVSLYALPARATDSALQCRRDARTDRRDCASVCSDNYQAALLLCGTPCVRACSDTRKACRGPIQDQLSADIKACNATRTAAIQLCRQQYRADPMNFDLDACIDAAQVAAFICRDDAREAAFPQLNTCNEAYHACVRACS